MILLREQVDTPAPGYVLGGPAVAALTLAPFVVLALASHGVVSACFRTLDRTGSVRAVRRADLAITLARWAGVVQLGVGVLLLGWLDVVRSWIGDLVLVDELVAAAPMLLLVVQGWASIWGIDRRLRDAMLLRRLDEGRSVHPPLDRGAFVAMHVRHQLLVVLVPMLAVVAWREAAHALARTIVELAARPGAPGLVAEAGRVLTDPARAPMALAATEVLGVVVVFVLMPLVIRRLWDTERLGDGPVRQRLAARCREQGVRVRDLLVWRTRGAIANAAVMGVSRHLRYILLTDALLEELPERELEAVMAHEVAHVRRRHMPWLAAVLVASVGGAGAAAAWLGELGSRLARPDLGPVAGPALELGVTSVVLALGLFVFGFASRRFEWQADAFAVQHLSRPDAPSGGGPFSADDAPSRSVTADAVAAMHAALDAVARLNNVAPARFSWRHGSIRQRQARLGGLVGLPVADLPIDRTVRRIKIAAAGMLGVLAVLVAMGW